MGAPSDRSLSGSIRLNLVSTNKKTDELLSPSGAKDSLSYTDISWNFTHGSGDDKVNLLYHKRHTLNNDTLLLNLDGGVNDVYGDALNFDAVKIIVVRNRETANNRYLEYQFKNEQGNIGSGGSRVIIEPEGPGIQALVSSSSAEEGNLLFTTDSNITFDVFVYGSHAESSSTGV